MIIPSCVAFLLQGRKVFFFFSAMGYAGGAPDSNNAVILQKITAEEPRFHDRRSNDIPDQLRSTFCVPTKIIYKSGVRLQRYPDLTI